jgi:hypothetical protein
MTFTLEVMLRGRETVFSEKIDHPGTPGTWTPADMRVVLTKVLQAIHRIQRPEDDAPHVELRGLNWIVSPYEGQVVIALEIPSASAVAGPFEVASPVLERLLNQSMASNPPAQTVH